MSEPITYTLLLVLLAAGMLLTVRLKKLTPAAAVTAAICGLLVFFGCGNTALALLILFFLMGTAATAWKKNLKPRGNDAPRTSGQVLANGGTAAVCGLLALLFPEKADLFTLLLAGSLSAATADTLSSELGMIYGKRFFNIISLKKDERGLDGVVSWEGIIIGFLGSAIIAGLYFNSMHSWELFAVVIVAGMFGNLLDSVLGATYERSGRINNNTVNLLTTFFGAVVALAGSLF